MTDRGSRQGGSGREGIAIVGMACLFPGSPSVDAYWQNILGKVDAVTDPPPNSWDVDAYYDPDFADTDKVYCKRGGYLGDLVSFDPLAHGIPPVAVGGEPDQWLALQVAGAAMADAGCTDLPEEIRRRTGVILGKGTYLNGGSTLLIERTLLVNQTVDIIKSMHPDYGDDQIEVLRSELKRALPALGPETMPGLIPNVTVGRIANRLDLMGPAYTVDAACASSLVAVEHAVRDLQDGTLDLVLCGGSQVWMPVPILNVFCHLGALSRREQIRPFDKDADGTLLGEGIGMVVLKRLTDAERDGDRIYAVIRGVGVASDGRGVGVMAPRVDGEELALRRAYDNAGISPRTIGLIEAHGTATPVGDEAEIQALRRVFGPRDGELPWCALGSVKSMISHTIPAAGVAGLIKTALALHHKVLPPTLNCAEPNPKLELETTPFYINTETRPWIHSGSEPRRAGVNAFGFGGINSHVIVEEWTDEMTGDAHRPAESGERRSSSVELAHLPAWESELFVLTGRDAQHDLVAQAGQLIRFLDQAEAAGTLSALSLKDLAYSVSCLEAASQDVRLAIVATSSADLREKLQRAVERLADPGCRQIKDKGGIYYFSHPLARGGKVAVLFPGEGSQYPNMLADICLHFPEARACFDHTDRVFRDHPRGYRLSDCVFPRPSFLDDERRWAETRLMEMDLAVEAVLTANQAVLAVLQRLGLRPDVYAGHSTGEYSALQAAGIMDLHDEERFAAFSHGLSRIYLQTAAEARVPTAMLLAIGADRETAEAIAREAGGEIYLAMDNCRHQSVLVGETDAAARAVEIIRREGLIYEQLLFDRAYHTPLFEPFGEQVRQVLNDIPFQAAHTPAYSCATAEPYPDEPERTRDVVVAHWSSPVQFRRTIETLYAEGVRVFVEAGPRGNLTTFVEDILRGQELCAVPANVQRRSGIAQLNHLAAILTAQGVDLDLQFLYERRRPKSVAWKESGEPGPRRPTLKIDLATSLPMLRISDDMAARISAAGSAPDRSEPATAGSGALLPPEDGQTDPALDEPVLSDVRAPRFEAASPGEPLPAPAPVQNADSDVMTSYLATMEQFLSVVGEVTQAHLGDVPIDAAPLAGFAPVLGDHSAAPMASAFPLIGSIVSLTPGQELVARRVFDLEEDRYLCDHTLGRDISVSDPSLRGLAFMPLTMSLEILAEAAACLLPGLRVAGLRSVYGRRLLAWEDEAQTLEVVARRLPVEGGQERVHVQLREASGDAGGVAAIEATVILAERYEPAPAPLDVRQIGADAPSRWRSDQLYTDLMFHGPSWQGVAAIERTGPGGTAATLRVLPVSEFFRSNPQPAFVLDPATLDAAGQTLGFWTAEQLTTHTVVFPFRLAAMEVFGEGRPAGEEVSCLTAIEEVGDRQVRANIDLVGGDGRLWIRLVGWEDKRFAVPETFQAPGAGNGRVELSVAWPEPIAHFPATAPFACRRMTVIDSDRPFWKPVWAMRILNRAERDYFRRLRVPEQRQMEWLAGRMAAKEAVLQLVREHVGYRLLPADVQILPDESGQPRVALPSWLDMAGLEPIVSVSHSQGEAVALAALIRPVGSGVPAVGVDIEICGARPPAFEAGAFSREELNLIRDFSADARDEWLLRLWCSKEAVGKALGDGMAAGPGALSVASVDASRGLVGIRPKGSLAALHPDLAAEEIVAYTGRYGGHVVATTCGEVTSARSTY